MLKLLKKSKKILGINSRNLDFIRPNNKKRALEIVDNKLRTKKVLEKNDLPTSKLIGVIRNREEFYNFDWQSLPNSFVLKPNRGLGGEGIMVTYGRKKNGKWVLPRDHEAGLKDVVQHVYNILDGNYSKINISDIAFFEERLKIHPAFKLYSYKGIPDIRVIIYNKVPIMAMLRLPTKQSKGKANLHEGGIGLGIDIATGITTHAIQFDQLIEYLPDIKLPLRGIKIPGWNNILELSIKAADACGLNYAGIDIALDKEQGPVILELNGHPGLSIQIANLSPLKERLLRVQGLKIKTVKKGISVAKEIFGGDHDVEIDQTSGKRIIGVINKVKIKGKGNNWTEIEAKMDTGAGISSIDEELARELGYGDAIDYYHEFDIKRVLTRAEVVDLKKQKIQEKILKHDDIVDYEVIYSSHGISFRIKIPLRIELAGVCINSSASVFKREKLKYDMIVGRTDLKQFLIDPSR